MVVYIGIKEGYWVHTYSTKLRDEHLGDNWIAVWSSKPGNIEHVRRSLSITDFLRWKKGQLVDREPKPVSDEVLKAYA